MIYRYYEIIQKKDTGKPSENASACQVVVAAQTGCAAKHPKTTFAGVAGTLLLLLVSTVSIDSGNGKQSEPDVSSIAAMEPVFQGFRTIQANKDIHRSVLTDMTMKGQLLRHELDSMIAIPVKSREDSLRIILKYRQLENIVKSIKNNDNP